MEYGSTVWDTSTQKDIDKLERIQRQAARFITRDYHSRDEGCMTRMLNELELPTLQQRRKELRLTLLFKVVGGKVPAIPPSEFLEPVRNRRKITPKSFSGCVTTNPMSKYETKNSKCFKIPVTKNPDGPYGQSFFVRTVIDWNKLDDKTVSAGSMDSFKAQIRTKF